VLSVIAPGKPCIVIVSTSSAGWQIRNVQATMPGQVARFENMPWDFAVAIIFVDGRVLYSNFHRKEVISADDLSAYNPHSPSRKGRKCSRCGSQTPDRFTLCIHCSFNYHSTWLGWVGLIPGPGAFFTTARAILSVGRAARSHCDVGFAVVDSLIAVIDLATTPFIVITAIQKVATKLGTELALNLPPMAIEFIRMVGECRSPTTIVKALQNIKDNLANHACTSQLHDMEHEAIRESFLDAFPCSCQNCTTKRCLKELAKHLIAELAAGNPDAKQFGIELAAAIAEYKV